MRRPHGLYASAQGGCVSSVYSGFDNSQCAPKHRGDDYGVTGSTLTRKYILNVKRGAQICIHALIVLLLASQLPCTGRFVGY